MCYRNSRPCTYCMGIIRDYGIRRVYYSLDGPYGAVVYNVEKASTMISTIVSYGNTLNNATKKRVTKISTVTEYLPSDSSDSISSISNSSSKSSKSVSSKSSNSSNADNVKIVIKKKHRKQNKYSVCVSRKSIRR